MPSAGHACRIEPFRCSESECPTLRRLGGAGFGHRDFREIDVSHLINWRIAAAILAALCLSALSHACTIFVVTYQGTTYFCNNEDWRDPVTRIRFFPAEGSNYGWVSLGFGNDWAQGGVNEHGLCFDWFAHGVSAGWKTDPEKRNHDGNLSEEMLRTCKTVDEAIEFYKRYNEENLDQAVTLIADRDGNSVLVLWKDGQLAFERNALTLQSCGIGKARVDAQVGNAGSPFSLESLAESLKAASLSGGISTQYSNIIVPRRGVLYLFQNRDYEQCLEIDYASMLKQPASEHRISDLFEHARKARFVRSVDPASYVQSSDGASWTHEEARQHARRFNNRMLWSADYLKQDAESLKRLDSDQLQLPFPAVAFNAPDYELTGRGMPGLQFRPVSLKEGEHGSFVTVNRWLDPATLPADAQWQEKVIAEPLMAIVVVGDIPLRNIAGQAVSRSHPHYFFQGAFSGAEHSLKWSAIRMADGAAIGVVNGRVLDLAQGNVILVRPESDGSIRIHQAATTLNPAESTTVAEPLQAILDEPACRAFASGS
jgi:hypothetical protein